MRARVIGMTVLPARYLRSVRGSQLARTHIARSIDAAKTGLVLMVVRTMLSQ